LFRSWPVRSCFIPLTLMGLDAFRGFPSPVAARRSQPTPLESKLSNALRPSHAALPFLPSLHAPSCASHADHRAAAASRV
jgi:hypothetical protein